MKQARIGLKRICILFAILAAAASQIHGKEPSTKPDVASLEDEFAAAVKTFMEEYRAADEKDRPALLEDPVREPRHRFTPKFLAEAERRKGRPEAVPYWTWLVENGTIVDAEIGERAVARLLADHLAHPGLAPAAKALARVAGVRGAERTIADLTRIVDGSPHAVVRAEALLRRGMVRHETEKSKAQQDFERAVAEAPDSDAGKKAAERLSASTPLKAGDQSPDFEGRRLSGGTVRLSELRGRIVLVDFWGMWCGPCVAQLPKLRSLSQQFAGKPFEIVGINSDADPEALRRFVTANRIDWITVLDGGTDGPVAKSWRLDSWPATFLLDGKGVIQARNPDLDSLATQVSKMLEKVTPPR